MFFPSHFSILIRVLRFIERGDWAELTYFRGYESNDEVICFNLFLSIRLVPVDTLCSRTCARCHNRSILFSSAWA
jgi:hypothetical protein